MMLVEYVSNRRFLDRDSLNFIERDFVLSAIIKFGRPRRFVVSDLLHNFEFAAVLQIGGDTGRTESMIADARLDAGRFRPPTFDEKCLLRMP